MVRRSVGVAVLPLIDTYVTSLTHNVNVPYSLLRLSPGYVGLQCEAEVDECVSNPCNPLGTERCVDVDNGFHCECNAGFSGELCETNVQECSSSPCLNGGTCADAVNAFRCLCPSGWTGARCESDIGHCSSEPCLNSGRCVDLFQDYFCVCPSGTDGKRCQTSPQRCIGNPCQHNGMCRDFGSGLNCSCHEKYTGIGCQYEYNACQEHACKNGATCLDYGSDYKCQCAAGWTGRHCDADVVDCTSTSCPPSATCVDLTAGFYCRCPFNLTGEDCRKPINIDYDLHINDESRSSSAALRAPFELRGAASLTLALWLQYGAADTAGVYVSLYSVESPHLPIGKRQLIQADHNGVLVSFFAEMPVVFIPYLRNVPVNDGQWHYINVIWSGESGTLMLVTDTAVAGTVLDYGVGLRLPRYGWVNLGSPLDDDNKAVAGAGFHGRVSRLNVWQRPLDMAHEIPAQFRSCKNAAVVHSGLLLRWTGYDRVEGTVEREGPGRCGERVCPTGYTGDDCRILQQDKIAPAVLHCPPDMWVITENASTVVFWDEPQFADDLRSVQVSEVASYRSGQALQWGTYDLSYVGTDEAGNAARCDFQIHVIKDFCPVPPPPVNGERQCSDWGPGGRFKACSVACNAGYEFSEVVPDFYICGAEGFWRPTEEAGRTLVFPACAPKHAAQRIFRIAISFPSSVVCSDSGKKILHARLSDSLLKVDRHWKICADNTRGSCRGMNVVVRCSKHGGSRSTRQAAEQGDVYHVEIAFPANNDPVASANGQQKSDVDAVVQRAILESAIFDVRDTLPNVVPDLTSLSLVTDYACPPGQVVIGSSCVECSYGSYYDETAAACLQCPQGAYQDELGQLECKACPLVSGKQGVTSSTGARSQSDCKQRCSVGNYFDTSHNSCRPCGYGLYQANEGAFHCIPCGLGLTTRSAEAAAQQECRRECFCLFAFEINYLIVS